jgi:hypothetical protein
MPRRGKLPIQYLAFLMRTHRTDAALDAWAGALGAADVSDPSDVVPLTAFVDFLAEANRNADAVRVWNQLVERGILHNGLLDPAKGISIADPHFQFPLRPSVFAWQMPDAPGVFGSKLTDSLRLDFNGDEPQSVPFVFTSAPVVPGTPYRLRWKSDGSALSSSKDPGLGFRIVQLPENTTTQCGPLLSDESSAVCPFTSFANSFGGQFRRVRIELQYTRAEGTTRIRGVLRILEARLEIVR